MGHTVFHKWIIKQTNIFGFTLRASWSSHRASLRSPLGGPPILPSWYVVRTSWLSKILPNVSWILSSSVHEMKICSPCWMNLVEIRTTPKQLSSSSFTDAWNIRHNRVLIEVWLFSSLQQECWTRWPSPRRAERFERASFSNFEGFFERSMSISGCGTIQTFSLFQPSSAFTVYWRGCWGIRSAQWQGKLDGPDVSGRDVSTKSFFSV